MTQQHSLFLFDGGSSLFTWWLALLAPPSCLPTSVKLQILSFFCPYTNSCKALQPCFLCRLHSAQIAMSISEYGMILICFTRCLLFSRLGTLMQHARSSHKDPISFNHTPKSAHFSLVATLPNNDGKQTNFHTTAYLAASHLQVTCYSTLCMSLPLP
jgi:hypothetical protein